MTAMGTADTVVDTTVWVTGDTAADMEADTAAVWVTLGDTVDTAVDMEVGTASTDMAVVTRTLDTIMYATTMGDTTVEGIMFRMMPIIKNRIGGNAKKGLVWDDTPVVRITMDDTTDWVMTTRDTVDMVDMVGTVTTAATAMGTVTTVTTAATAMGTVITVDTAADTAMDTAMDTAWDTMITGVGTTTTGDTDTMVTAMGDTTAVTTATSMVDPVDTVDTVDTTTMAGTATVTVVDMDTAMDTTITGD